jgi:ATP-binding cassette subfamily B protein
MTGLLRSSRISVYAMCDRIVRRIGSKVTRLPLGWFDSTSASKVSNAMSEDVQTLSHLGPVVLPGLISGIVTPLTVAVAVLFIQPLVGVLLLIVVPLAAICMYWSVRVLQRVHPLGARRRPALLPGGAGGCRPPAGAAIIGTIRHGMGAHASGGR